MSEAKQILVERTINMAINELDALIALANDPEAVSFIESEKPSIGIIKRRTDLLIASLLARSEPKFVNHHATA
jgi:hypothetical protein